MDSITYPFQKSYASFLHSALDECERNREKTFKKKTRKTFTQDGKLPYTAWILDAGALEIFLMRRVHRIAGDVAILKSKTPNSHIILYGEAAKQNLNEGIADFVVEGPDIKAELKAIMDAWQAYVYQTIPDPTADNRFAPRKFIESQLKQADPIHLVTTYLYPIERGENNMWRNLQYYDFELRLLGLPVYEVPTSSNAKLDHLEPL